MAELEEAEAPGSTWNEEYWKGIAVGIVILIALILIIYYFDTKEAGRE